MDPMQLAITTFAPVPVSAPSSQPFDVLSPDTPINSGSPLCFDLGDVPTPDLLNEINPELLDYVKCNTPQVYSGLLAQDRNQLPNPQPAAVPAVTSQFPQAVDPAIPATSNSLQLSSPLVLNEPMQTVSSVPVFTPPTSAPVIPVPIAPSVPVVTSVPPVSMPASAVHNFGANPSAHISRSVPRVKRQAAVPVKPSTRTPVSVPNPTLMAVLQQAQAISNVPHFNPQMHMQNRYFPPSVRLSTGLSSSSPLQPNSAAAVAAVAGAAAAAAAAANYLSSATNPHYISHPMQHKPFPQRAPPLVYTHPRQMQSRPSTVAQANLVPRSPSSRPVAATAAATMASSQVPLQPQPPPSRIAGQKRPSSAIKRTPNAAPNTVPPSLLVKRPSTSSLTSTQSNPAQPLTGRKNVQGHIPAAVASTATVVNPANVATTVNPVPMQLKLERTEQTSAQSALASNQASDAEEDLEAKKAMRAERNRQSAAASRERKKQHIKELERRVETLSKENALMQLSQLRTVRDRIQQESKILSQVKELKKKVVDKDMEIHKLSRQLKNAKIKYGEYEGGSEIPRPSTWDAAEWKKKKGTGSIG